MSDWTPSVITVRDLDGDGGRGIACALETAVVIFAGRTGQALQRRTLDARQDRLSGEWMVVGEPFILPVIHYQGRVSVGGTNFHGTGSFKFALVDAGADRRGERPRTPRLRAVRSSPSR